LPREWQCYGGSAESLAAIWAYLNEGSESVRVNYRKSDGTHYKIEGYGTVATVVSTSQGKWKDYEHLRFADYEEPPSALKAMEPERKIVGPESNM